MIDKTLRNMQVKAHKIKNTGKFFLQFNKTGYDHD